MTASAFDQGQHGVAAAAGRLQAELDLVAEASVWSLGPEELRVTLVSLTRAAARVAELQLRVAAGADRADVGAKSGATSTASWWAHETKQTRAGAHRSMRLAHSLDWGHELVRDALAAGDLLVDQAQVIVDAVDALPEDLVDPELVREAERRLVVLARDHDAKELRILGRRILDIIAPEIGEAHEARQLEQEERRAAELARFTISDDGHGRMHGRFSLPTLQGELLCKQLMALSAPGRQTSTTGTDGTDGTDGAGRRRPSAERMGRAFMEYVERYPADRLPTAGGVAATVVVSMPLDSLLGGLRAAQLDTGGVISASLARRLACEAGIIPAVLGGKSQVLDLGRKVRFHNEPQRIVIGVRDGSCTTVGCDWPRGLCHVHHDPPWGAGGGTDVEHARLLCPHHHARAHDSKYELTRLPGGKVAFNRRT